MAGTATALPYGLRAVKVYPLNTDGTFGTGVDLPVAQTFSFSESEETTELRGDDTVVAIHGQGPEVEWELEAGGISFGAAVLINGGTKTSTGTAPSITETYTKKTTDTRPYFGVEGQSISDSGGDFHAKLYRCKADGSFEGEMADGEFWVTSASGRALGSLDTANADKIYTFTKNPTVTAIV